MKWTLLAVVLGFLMDLCFGDPRWLYHPVCLIGNLIAFLEKILRKIFPKTDKGELAAGTVEVILVCLLSGGIPFLMLHILYGISVWAGFALETFWCYQLLATKSLKTESMKVYDRLKNGTLDEARYAVSMIVGRDTQSLTEEGVTKAAVETVAENASDGVIAPMLYMAIGGVWLMFLYKGINTMDSMLGYKNDKYLYFGRFAAKLDDVVNFIPARIGGCLMVVSAGIAQLAEKCNTKDKTNSHYSIGNAWKIFKSDRKKHSSPNAAQTESACAGALKVALSGDNYYFGKLVHKPQIGEAIRPLEAGDIGRSNILLYITAFLMVIIVLLIRLIIMLAVR